MISAYSKETKVFVCQEPIHMARSFKGLREMVQISFPKGEMNGYFVFFNKTKTKVKVLYWDKNGFSIWYKELEYGSFALSLDKNKELTYKEFAQLLNNITDERKMIS